jgi:Ca2+-binding EF-hand superfamily protein
VKNRFQNLHFKCNLQRYSACNTIDECFRLFDEDSSGEIDVDEMEMMQSLIGDFGGALQVDP